MKTKEKHSSTEGLSQSNLSIEDSVSSIVRAFEYVLVHWLVTEVDPFDVSVWCKGGSARKYITFDFHSGKFMVRCPNGQLNLGEVVLGTQEITAFDSAHLGTLDCLSLVPADWGEEDLELYIEDLFYYWRTQFSLRDLIIGSLGSLDLEYQRQAVKGIFIKSADLLSSIDNDSLEACILDYQNMCYNNTSAVEFVRH